MAKRISIQSSVKGVLNPRRWVEIVLTDKRDISHDTRLFQFELQKKRKKIGLPTGQHVLLAADAPGAGCVVRPYTPIFPSSPKEDNGILLFAIKIYQFGRMTQYLDALSKGAILHMKGPSGPILYLGNGTFVAHGTTVHATRISMIAGGTGITPMFQMAKAILDENSKENICIRLLFANKTPADILLRNELDGLAKNHKDHFSVWYTVSSLPGAQKTDNERDQVLATGKGQDWQYSVGSISTHMIQEHLFAPSESHYAIALVCGPPAMVAHACVPGLEEVGYTQDNLFEF